MTNILLFKGEGSVQAYHFGKKNFEIGVGEEGQDTSRHFEGTFGSIVHTYNTAEKSKNRP